MTLYGPAPCFQPHTHTQSQQFQCNGQTPISINQCIQNGLCRLKINNRANCRPVSDMDHDKNGIIRGRSALPPPRRPSLNCAPLEIARGTKLGTLVKDRAQFQGFPYTTVGAAIYRTEIVLRSTNLTKIFHVLLILCSELQHPPCHGSGCLHISSA
jgi:hypothetical protein